MIKETFSFAHADVDIRSLANYNLVVKLFISLVINCLLSIFVSLLKFLLGIVYSYPVPIFILGS